MLRQTIKFFTTIKNHFAATIENPLTKGFISYAWEQDADKFGLICLAAMEQTPTIAVFPKTQFKASYIRVQVNNREKLYYSYYQTPTNQALIDITPTKVEKLKELDDAVGITQISAGTIKQLERKELQSINEIIGHGQMEKNREVQNWIKRLQEDLEATALQEVFLDIKRMHGDLKHAMRTNLEQSDVVFFICNFRFNERFSESNNCGLVVIVQEPTLDNLSLLNLPYTNAYLLFKVGTEQRLYYKNSWNIQRIELDSDNFKELEKVLGIIPVHKLLSIQELQKITAIANHAHNNLVYEVHTVLNEMEKRPNLKVITILQGDAANTTVPPALELLPIVDLTGPYSAKKFTGFHTPGLLANIYDLKKDEIYQQLLYGYYLSKIPRATKLFGRDKELEDLKQSVAQEPLSYLIGEEDTGLSALAVNFAKQAHSDIREQRYPLVRYFQVDSQDSWVELIKAFAVELEVDSSNWWQALSDLPVRWLIVIDSSRIKIGWEPYFKSTSYQQRLLRVQSTSIETPARVISISPLTIEARLQIIRHYLGNNSLEDEKKLIVQYRCSLTELMATINYIKASPLLDINRFLKYNLRQDVRSETDDKATRVEEILDDEFNTETTEQLLIRADRWPLLKAGVKRIVGQRKLTIGLLYTEKEVDVADKFKSDIQDCGINVVMSAQAQFPKLDALIVALTPNFKINFNEELRTAIADIKEGKVYPLIMIGDFASSVPPALYSYLIANQKDGYEKVLLGLEPLGIISAICGFHAGQHDYEHYWYHYSYSNLPRLDTKLMGRFATLSRIKELLASQDICKKEKLVAISGMGGFGKSSLAIMYGHKYQEDYDLIRVINSEGQALSNSLLTFASDLGIEIKGKKITEVIPDLHAKLTAFARYLLIFDNVTTFDEIREHLAPLTQPGQHILVTSRDSTGWSNKIELGVFSKAEASEYLTKELGEDSLELAMAMGFLPLALNTTAAFIKQKRQEETYSIEDYLNDYQTGMIKEADNPVKRSLILALPKIAAVSVDALHLLRYCAFMGPEPITPEWLEKLLGSMSQVHIALNVVSSFSMITVNNYKLVMHRLMSEAIRESIELTPEEIYLQYLLPLKELLVSLYPWEKPKLQDYALAQQLTAHIEKLESHMAALSDSEQISEITQNEVRFARGLLLSMCADAYSDVGEFEKQRDLLQKSLPLIKGKDGDENTELEYAITLNELASAYGNLDNYLQQRNILEQALPILQKYYGNEHIEVGKLLVNLATAYGGLNDYVQQQELLEQTLPIMEHAYGKAHANYAITLANFAQVYGKISNYAKQQELLNQALAIKKEKYGDRHISYAITLVALANALGNVKNYTEQLELLETARDIYKETYGEEHARTAEIAQQIAQVQTLALEHSVSIEIENESLATPIPETPGELHQKQEEERRYQDIIGPFVTENKVNLYAEKSDMTSLSELFEIVIKPLQERLSASDVMRKVPIDFPDKTRRTALHWIIRHREEEMAARFIAAGADVNWHDENGWSPLHVAVMRGNLEIARNLLLNGADYKLLTTKDYKEEDDDLIYPARSSARDIAVLEDYPEIIELIDTNIKHSTSSLDERRTALMQITDVLLEAQFKVTDLTFAVRCGDLEKAEEFLIAGANPNGQIDSDPYIVYAAKNVDFSMCKLLHRFHANMRVGDAYNNGLYWAIKSGLYHSFRFFFAQYSTDEITSGDKAAAFLHTAVESNNADIFTELLDAGINPDIKGKSGKAAIHYIVEIRDDIIRRIFMERLLIKKPDLNVQDDKGDTALHYAVKSNYSFGVELLLRNGANYKILNKDKLTPLIQAQKIKNLKTGFKIDTDDVIKILLRYQISGIESEYLLLPGSDQLNLSESLLKAAIRNDLVAVDAILQIGVLTDNCDKQNRTALHWAVLHHNLEMVEKLIKVGADINSQDMFGLTPFYLAIYHLQKEIIDLFIAANADIFLLLDKCYQEEGRAICWPLTRGLMIAKETGDDKVYQKLQDYAYSKKMASTDNQLVAAMASYNFPMAKKCLEAGASSDTYDENWPILFYAVESNDIELLKLLKIYNVNILLETKDTKQNMLEITVSYSTDKIILEYVLSLGFDVNRQNPVNLASPMVTACYYRSREFIKLLYDKGADVDLLDKSGRNPFLALCRSDNITETIRLQTARYLIEQTTVDVEAKDNEHKNSIHWAALRGSRELFQILIERKVLYKTKSDAGWTPLMCACKIDDEWIAGNLIKEGSDIEASDNSDSTVLKVAVENQSVRCVELLLNKGVDGNRLSGKYLKTSALFLAADSGNVTIVAMLLDYPSINIDIKTSDNRTAVIQAAQRGYYNVVKILVAKGAELNHYDSKGWTALKAAVQQGYIETVKVLLGSGNIDPNYRMKAPINMQSPLNVACRDGKDEVVKLLLTAPGIDVSQNEDFGDTGLTKAAEYNHIEVVKLLLAEENIDLNAIDTDGNTALMLARQNGCKKIEQLILRQMATKRTIYPLHQAVENEDKAELEKLLDNDIYNINTLNAAKETALYVASRLGKTLMVVRLLQYPKINVDIPNAIQMTPLYAAVTYGYREIVKILIDAKADINKVGPMGVTTLSQSVQLGREDIVEELLTSFDLNPNVVDSSGSTALSYSSFLNYAYKGLSYRYRYFRGDRISVQTLLLQYPFINVNIHDTTRLGYSIPLIKAAPHVEFMRQILQHPLVKINATTQKGGTVFSETVIKTYKGLASLYMILSRPGVNINVSYNDGTTALNYMAEILGHNYDYEYIKILLQVKGIMVNKANHRGETPLWHAAQVGKLEILKLILAHPEIDITKTNSLGETPLHIAVSEGQEDIVKELVMHARLNGKDSGLFISDKNGLTPKLVAIKQANLPISTYLKEVEDEVLCEQQQIEQAKLARKTLRQIRLTEKSQKVEKLIDEDSLNEHDNRQIELEADQYLGQKLLLKSFKYRLESKLMELFLAYKNGDSKTITLLGDLVIIPEITLVRNNDTQLSSISKLILGVTDNIATINITVQKIVRLLLFQYEEQILNLKDENQAEILAECTMLRILAIIQDDLLVNSFPLWEQLGFIIGIERTQEAYKKLKDRVITNNGDKERVWSDKAIFELTGIRLKDGRCFDKPNVETNIYGYRLGTEEEIQSIGLIEIPESAASSHALGGKQYNFVMRSPELINILSSLILKDNSLPDIVMARPTPISSRRPSIINEDKRAMSTVVANTGVNSPILQHYSSSTVIIQCKVVEHPEVVSLERIRI